MLWLRANSNRATRLVEAAERLREASGIAILAADQTTQSRELAGLRAVPWSRRSRGRGRTGRR